MFCIFLWEQTGFVCPSEGFLAPTLYSTSAAQRPECFNADILTTPPRSQAPPRRKRKKKRSNRASSAPPRQQLRVPVQTTPANDRPAAAAARLLALSRPGSPGSPGSLRCDESFSVDSDDPYLELLAASPRLPAAPPAHRTPPRLPAAPPAHWTPPRLPAAPPAHRTPPRLLSRWFDRVRDEVEDRDWQREFAPSPPCLCDDARRGFFQQRDDDRGSVGGPHSFVTLSRTGAIGDCPRALSPAMVADETSPALSPLTVAAPGVRAYGTPDGVRARSPNIDGCSPDTPPPDFPDDLDSPVDEDVEGISPAMPDRTPGIANANVCRRLNPPDTDEPSSSLDP